MSRTYDHPPSQPRRIQEASSRETLKSRWEAGDPAPARLSLPWDSTSLGRVSSAQAALFRPRKAPLGQSLTCCDKSVWGHVFSVSRLPSTVSSPVRRSSKSFARLRASAGTQGQRTLGAPRHAPDRSRPARSCTARPPHCALRYFAHINPDGRCWCWCCPHFVNERLEPRRRKETCPRSLSHQRAGPAWPLQSPALSAA